MGCVFPLVANPIVVSSEVLTVTLRKNESQAPIEETNATLRIRGTAEELSDWTLLGEAALPQW